MSAEGVFDPALAVYCAQCHEVLKIAQMQANADAWGPIVPRLLLALAMVPR